MNQQRLLRLSQVKDATGVRRSTIYKLMAEGQFPRSVRITPRCVAWRSDEVEAWIATRPCSGGRQQ